MSSYEATIAAELGQLSKALLGKSPDAKHNTGRILSEAFMWDAIAKIAKGRSEDAWSRVEEITGEINQDLGPGEHTIANSPHLEVVVKVTNPVRRFDPETLANKLHEKYKVSKPTSLKMIEDAKVGKKSNVSASVVEKSDAF